MATFRVGQRVRIANANALHILGKRDAQAINLVGQETVITEIGAINCYGDSMYGVAIDDGRWMFYDFNLEPIVDDGRQVIAWDRELCPWVPEHLRERAGASGPTETPTVGVN